MSLDTIKILREIYPESMRLEKRHLLAGKRARRRITIGDGVGSVFNWAKNLGLAGATVIGFLGLWGYGILHYYNKFVQLRSNVYADWSDVQVVIQERHYIVNNLTKLIMDYERHERNLLTKITELRTADSMMPGKTASAEEKAMLPQTVQDVAKGIEIPAGNKMPTSARSAGQYSQEKIPSQQVDALLSKIGMVAEQYPQLKLTENIQQMAAAIIETEHKIAELLIKYNKDVNTYSTARDQWPGRHYAWLLKFKGAELFVADPSSLKVRDLEFR